MLYKRFIIKFYFGGITRIKVSFLVVCSLLYITTLHLSQVIRVPPVASLYPISLRPQLGQNILTGIRLEKSIFRNLLLSHEHIKLDI